jgi:beta-carotene hydroxylase
MPTNKQFDPPPRLPELGLDLLEITPGQRLWTITVPFILIVLYFVAAHFGYWVIAVGAVMYLSFVTYGSTSHDLVHRNLGLTRVTNEIFLTLIELLSLRSGHAYRLSHFHHHARYPADDDLEAAASKRSLGGALLEGVTFHIRLWLWAIKRTKGSERKLIVVEAAWPC